MFEIIIELYQQRNPLISYTNETIRIIFRSFVHLEWNSNIRATCFSNVCTKNHFGIKLTFNSIVVLLPAFRTILRPSWQTISSYHQLPGCSVAYSHSLNYWRVLWIFSVDKETFHPRNWLQDYAILQDMQTVLVGMAQQRMSSHSVQKQQRRRGKTLGCHLGVSLLCSCRQ